MPGGKVHGDWDHLLQLGAGAGQPLGHQPGHQAADIVDIIDIIDNVDNIDIGIYSDLATRRGRVAAPAQRTWCILLGSLETARNLCKL